MCIHTYGDHRYIDPIGGGFIALYIIVSWFQIARTHIDKIVGKSAPDDFIQQVCEGV
jgi:divalent metal cation (Fe/Co/Zn/Cd) transporter